MTIRKHLGLISGVALLALTLNSCDTPTGRGAAYGAAAGAIIGGAATGRARGASIGAAAGAATGALIGNAIQRDEAERTAPPPPNGYPWGRRSGRPGLVYSPYPPHRLIDVRGIPHGEMVKDTSTGGIFLNPERSYY
jgi:outer membrane protein with glycine zipper